jgi:hypothetical protein
MEALAFIAVFVFFVGWFYVCMWGLDILAQAWYAGARLVLWFALVGVVIAEHGRRFNDEMIAERSREPASLWSLRDESLCNCGVTDEVHWHVEVTDEPGSPIMTAHDQHLEAILDRLIPEPSVPPLRPDFVGFTVRAADAPPAAVDPAVAVRLLQEAEAATQGRQARLRAHSPRRSRRHLSGIGKLRQEAELEDSQ